MLFWFWGNEFLSQLRIKLVSGLVGGGSRCSPGGSNEPPELGPKKLFIIFFKFDAPKIKFEPPKLKNFFKPSLNEFEYDHFDKKNPNNKPIWSKIWGENSKPNNKSIIFFILNL